MGTARLTAGVVCLCACLPDARRDGPLETLAFALRPDDDPAEELLQRFDAEDVVESFDSVEGSVRVHFTRAGRNAVRVSDADGDGMPDDVVVLASAYERVLASFGSLGFRAPISDLGTLHGDGGDGRLDVYMLDFDGSADGSYVREVCEQPSRCSGYVAQENDFAGYRYASFESGARTLASHELFHAVQAAYDADQGANFAEATAVWASERFDPTLTDFEAQIAGYLQTPERSVDQEPIKPVDPYAYGLGLFVQFLDERFGPELIVRIWEGCENGADGSADPRWLDVLVKLLRDEHAVSFRDAWFEYAGWIVHSGFARTARLGFANGASYPRVTRRVAKLPFKSEGVRMFHAALRAWSFAPGTRSEVGALLVLPDAGELSEDLGLLVATRRGDTLSLAAERRGEIYVDAQDAEEVIVIIANGAASGSSLKPFLCVGSRDELARCRDTLAEQSGDAGAPDDAGPRSGEQDAASAGNSDSGGCSMRGPDAGIVGQGAMLGLLAACAWLRRRARRRSL